MRTHLFILLIMLFINTAQAQNSFSIKVFGGLGSGWVKEDNFFEKNKRTNSDVSFLGAISVGYNISKIRLNAGLGMMGNVYSQELALLQSNPNPQPGASPFVSIPHLSTEVYRYIILPITAGYNWRIGQKLILVPEAGLMSAYNMGIIYKMENTETNKETSTTDKPGTKHSLFSLSGLAALNAEYYVRQNVGFTIGATYVRNITNMLKVPDDYVYKASRRESAYTINLGVIFRL